VRGDALVLVTQSAAKHAAASLKAVAENQSLVLEIENDSREGRITELKFERALATQFGLSPPDGFKEEPLPLSEGEKSDKDMVGFVASFNRETVRWVGVLPLPPGAKAQLVIPASSTSGLTGIISLQCESKVGFGGSISTLRVNLGALASHAGQGA